MKYKVKWTKNSVEDLQTIVDFISKDNRENAKNIYIKIKNKTRILSENPMIGRILPEFENFHINRYREIIVKPWRIIYLIENDIVYILSIIDGRRDVESILLSRLLK